MNMYLIRQDSNILGQSDRNVYNAFPKLRPMSAGVTNMSLNNMSTLNILFFLPINFPSSPFPDCVHLEDAATKEVRVR